MLADPQWRPYLVFPGEFVAPERVVTQMLPVDPIDGKEGKHHKLPHQVRKRSGDFSPNRDTITVLTMHVSKGLEFPVVALPGVGQMPAAGEDEHEEARLFYVGATRATQKLVITVSGEGDLGVGWRNDR
ncbi:MAG: ATP-binding domain-containing protein [Polaromonas sp.]|nr:ATP-binding domain-containing protein [Polaromonas sp.]